MDFNRHSELEGQHAFLSASKYHWINYDDLKIDDAYAKFLAIQKGTELHDFARRCIELKIKLPNSKKALNRYVNDAIGYRMRAEQILFYSTNAFGTADAISFRENYLRIHDLKTGVTPVSMRQVEVYAALFCLEYEQKPIKLQMELRIYQGDEVFVHVPPLEDIAAIMEKIIRFDKRIALAKLEAED